MKFTLTEGTYSRKEALELLTRMVHLNIRICEERLKECGSGDERKELEENIRSLHRGLYEMQRHLAEKRQKIALRTEISF